MFVLFDEGRRQNTSAICLESGDGFCYVGHAELKNLLWELYRLPGRQSQRMERKCQELYEGWGIQLPDVNCNYLSCAVGVVYGTSQKLAIRKEILQAVSEQYDVSVSAVDSGIRRMNKDCCGGDAPVRQSFFCWQRLKNFAETPVQPHKKRQVHKMFNFLSGKYYFFLCKIKDAD